MKTPQLDIHEGDMYYELYAFLHRIHDSLDPDMILVSRPHSALLLGWLPDVSGHAESTRGNICSIKQGLNYS